MAAIFGVEENTAWAVPRLRITQPRSVILAIDPGVSQFVYAFDMTEHTAAGERLRFTIEVSADNQATWRDCASSEIVGGAVSAKTGETPRGMVRIPAGTTHVRVTLVPLTGPVTIGITAAAA